MAGGQTYVLIPAAGLVIVISVIAAAIGCCRRRPAKNLKIDSRESTNGQERAVPQAKWAEGDEVKSPRDHMNDTAEATAADIRLNTMCQDVKDELKSMTQAIMDRFCKIESDVNELKANVSNILERPVVRAEWTDLQDLLVKAQGAQNIPADEILRITAAGKIVQVTAGDIARQGKNNSRAHAYVMDDIKSNKIMEQPTRPWPHKFKNNLFLRYWKPKLLRCMVTGLELPWNQVIGAHIIPKSQAATTLRDLGMDGDAVANGMLWAKPLELAFTRSAICFSWDAELGTLVFHVLHRDLVGKSLAQVYEAIRNPGEDKRLSDGLRARYASVKLDDMNGRPIHHRFEGDKKPSQRAFTLMARKAESDMRSGRTLDPSFAFRDWNWPE